MSIWDRLKATVRREAADVASTAKRGMDRMEAALERRQRELDATPEERMEMLLEGVDEEQAHIEALAEEVRARTGEALPSDTLRTDPPPQLDLAIEWLTAEELIEGDPLASRFSHRVRMAAWIEIAVGTETFAAMDDAIRADVFVLDLHRQDRETLYVRTPTLTPDEVERLVATTFAAAIPDDWTPQLD
jgi:hypothetical protein